MTKPHERLMNRRDSINIPDKQRDGKTMLGIHLAGPNVNRTSLVWGSLSKVNGQLHVKGVLDKIGSQGAVFSDDRIVDLLQLIQPDEVILDCPLTFPPCVNCQLESCPGVVRCEDTSVSYMLAIDRRNPRKSRRPVNPQINRIWDLLHLRQSPTRLEPSFSPNMAPLVTRARTLQKRLNGIQDKSNPIILRETNIPAVLAAINGQLFEQVSKLGIIYRRFEDGRKWRKFVLDHLCHAKLVTFDAAGANLREKIVSSVENFHGLLCSWVAGMCSLNLVAKPPSEFIENEGWVFLPHMDLSSESSQQTSLPLEVDSTGGLNYTGPEDGEKIGRFKTRIK